MALDVAKAYDSIDRTRMFEILSHMRVAQNKFFKLLWRSLMVGSTAVCGGGMLSAAWLSQCSHGTGTGIPAFEIIYKIPSREFPFRGIAGIPRESRGPRRCFIKVQPNFKRL